MLYTKSIREKPSKEDGIRICIMRNPDSDAYDIWMPQLSPSKELRDEVKRGIGWEKFKEKFEKELNKDEKFLKFIANSAVKSDITLLCVEDNPSYCHRSLVAAAIKKINPKLKIEIK
jgi:uncharacterized protein YeaO (DUF488 family)